MAAWCLVTMARRSAAGLHGGVKVKPCHEAACSRDKKKLRSIYFGGVARRRKSMLRKKNYERREFFYVLRAFFYVASPFSHPPPRRK